MKKALALVLTLVMVLSLTACGGSGEKKEDTAEKLETTESIEKMIIGTWEKKWTAEEDGYYLDDQRKGDNFTATFELFEGGKFNIVTNNVTQQKEIVDVKGEYVVEDNYLKIEYGSDREFKYTFKIDLSNNTLTDVTDPDNCYSKVK